MVPVGMIGWSLLVATGLCGCGEDEVPDPPVAQSALVGRLFDALKNGRLDEALSLTEKLQSLDSENLDLAELKLRIIANGYVLRCQAKLDAGDTAGALAIIREGCKLYPMHSGLRVLDEELTRLNELHEAAQSLGRAKSAAELSAVLERIAPLSAAYPEAKLLQQDIIRRRGEFRQLQNAPRGKPAAEVVGPVRP